MTYDELWILAMKSMLDHEGKPKNQCKTYSDI